MSKKVLVEAFSKVKLCEVDYIVEHDDPDHVYKGHELLYASRPEELYAIPQFEARGNPFVAITRDQFMQGELRE